MRQGWQGTLLRGLLLLLLLLGSRRFVASQALNDSEKGKRILFGDKCSFNEDCEFDGAVCEDHGCRCAPDLPVSNHYDKCGKAARVNESCFFSEQCEAGTPETDCRDGLCSCMFEKQPMMKNGKLECVEKDKRILFGDKCSFNEDCEFEGAVCGDHKCRCAPDLPVSNHYDKCGKAARVNESCFFSEQCEAETPETDCRDGLCSCIFEKQPMMKNGKLECVVVQNVHTPSKYIDPAMIGILVAMFLMFITICVVLRLFSRARWRENRTIFNTPNPRLMNVSLLRENKLLHSDRRGSRTSARGPSRQPSMASLRAHSPNSQGRLFLGSRRGSRGSSNASATSNRSNKSPPQQQAPNISSATTPMLESVTVEVQEPKA